MLIRPVKFVRLITAMWVIAIAMFQNSLIGAETVKNIQSLVEKPVFVRGGAMMLPLAAERPGIGWPKTLELTLGKDEVISGMVAWLEPATRHFERHWTDDPRSIRVRAILPTDDSSTVVLGSGYGPYLLGNAPDDSEGELRLGKQKMKPVWIDAPAARG